MLGEGKRESLLRAKAGTGNGERGMMDIVIGTIASH
jgi:hypothetical protein